MKKSLYLFLSSMLGAILFLLLHRLLVFVILIAIIALNGHSFLGLTFIQFAALDYFTLILVLMLGAWYGIWVGEYWYLKVYEEKVHGGVVSHLATVYWPRKKQWELHSKINSLAKEMRHEMWEIKDLEKSLPSVAETVKPIKRRVARKKAPKITKV